VKVLSDVRELPAGERLVVAVGVFDGVHRGHCRVLRASRETAARLRARSAVITFEPHPRAVVGPGAPPLLCDLPERLARLERAGVDLTVVQRFDRPFAELSAEDFLERVREGRRLAAVIMGRDSAFGHRRGGTAANMAEVGRRIGFELVRVDLLALGGERVSSTRIREQVAEGRLAQARLHLGRSHAVRGTVVRGDGRGRGLGFPTANLAFEEPVALPPDGIYATLVSWDGSDPLAPARRNRGVASLGVRPTFGPGGRVLEAHLLDFDEDIYGERLRVTFVRRQRGERRFAEVDALVHQMRLDTARARTVLARSGASAAAEHPC
jgi:riboflavin kinase/FMN adenylyltransferase